MAAPGREEESCDGSGAGGVRRRQRRGRGRVVPHWGRTAWAAMARWRRRRGGRQLEEEEGVAAPLGEEEKGRVADAQAPHARRRRRTGMGRGRREEKGGGCRRAGTLGLRFGHGEAGGGGFCVMEKRRVNIFELQG